MMTPVARWIRCALPAVTLPWLVLAACGAPALAATPAGVNQVYVVVNDGVITRMDFEEKYREVLGNYRGRGVQPPPAKVLGKQVLDNMVTEKLQLQVAARAGVRVGEQEVLRNIADIAESNGLSVEQLRDEIRRRGLDPAMFRERIRQQLVIEQLVLREIRNRVVVTEEEVDQYLRGRVRDEFRDREMDLGHIVVPLREAPDAAALRRQRAIADRLLERLDNGESFRKIALRHATGDGPWDGTRMGWVRGGTLPEFVLLALDGMEPDDHSRVLRGPRGFHIVKLYGARGGGEEQRMEQVHLRYILLKTDQVVDAGMARRRLGVLRQRVAQGEDFEALAREYSQDMESREQGGDAGWVNVVTLPAPYAQAVRGLRAGEVSEPFLLGDQALIVQLLERRHSEDGDEMRRLQARSELTLRKTRDEHGRWLRQLRGNAHIRYNDIGPPPDDAAQGLGQYLE